jgi:hypothetical protein
MPQWVTIGEAIKRTGKSENTIRRLIYEAQKTNQELAARVIQKSPTGAYQIETGFLYTKYPPVNTHEHPKGSTSEQPISNQSPPHQSTQAVDPTIQAKDETIALLKAQLEKQAVDYKEQLTKKDEQMKMLLDRMRENNIILQGLALPAPQKDKVLEPIEVVRGTHDGNHENTHDVPMSRPSGQPKNKVMSTKPKQKSKSKKSDQPNKKGLFGFWRK